MNFTPWMQVEVISLALFCTVLVQLFNTKVKSSVNFTQSDVQISLAPRNVSNMLHRCLISHIIKKIRFPSDRLLINLDATSMLLHCKTLSSVSVVFLYNALCTSRFLCGKQWQVVPIILI